MKVEIYKGNLTIAPETDFEKEWLLDFEIRSVFHKTGLSASDYIGIKICN